jgi:hypothetical protein
MQEKESESPTPKEESQDFDLLNTLEPKPDYKDEGGLEEVFPETEYKSNNDDFLLNLLSTENIDSPTKDEDVKESNSALPFQESKKEAAQNLISLEELLGDGADNSSIQNNEIDSHKSNRPKVTAKKHYPVVDEDNEEEFDALGDDTPTNNVPDFNEAFNRHPQPSLAETVHLDNKGSQFVSVAGENNVKLSKAPSGQVDDFINDDHIGDAVSDDDEEAKQEWDKFMQESEEFGSKQNEQKIADRELTQSELQDHIEPRNAFDYF